MYLLKTRYWFLFLICLALFACVVDSHAQVNSTNRRAQQHYENSRKHLQLNKYSEAIRDLEKAVAEDSQFATAYQQLGDIYRLQQKYKEAVPHYQRVMELHPTLTPLTRFGLGEALLLTGKYQEAIPHLERYKQGNISDKSKRLVDKYLADCAYALSHRNGTVIALEKLPATINSSNNEYFPKLTADNTTVIFTRKENNQENFYESHRSESGEWSEAQKLVGSINSSTFNEGAHCISPDGKYLFFTGCNWPNGLGSCDIYVSKRENGVWTDPMNLGAPINTSGWESQPAISADGRTLYFVSNRAGGLGGNDIWKSELGEDGVWQQPVNLGPNINTEFSEASPYIHADNKTLYFASNGWPGYGGQDIFMNQMDSLGQWQQPRNIGWPINNHLDQNGLHVNMSGSMGFFSSQDSTGQLDIYTFRLPAEIRPHSVAYIRGVVLDSETRDPLLATISVTNTTNHEVVFEDVSDYLDGEFIATLPIGSNYAVHVQREGYLFDSQQYDLSDIGLADEEFATEILLDRIKSGRTTRLNNIYFDVNRYDLLPESQSDLQLLFAFLRLNSSTQIEIAGHTDSTGNKEANVVLSQRRAQAVLNYLVQQGIPPQQVSSKGYGDSQPVSSNDTAEGRQLNRRTEIKILH